MKIYLAGAITGNNGYIYRKIERYMNIRLVDYKRVFNKRLKEDMKLFLAGEGGKVSFGLDVFTDIYILESFYYLQKNEWMKALVKQNILKGFLLDSGAFTFMTGAGGKVNWEEYVDKYAQFIKDYDIDLFFELDIDSVVGLEKVEELRKRLEDKAEKKCIPVWHKSRGKECFIKMCKDYNYIAIGGIVTKEIKRTEHPVFAWLIKTAHENNCKIHGLGYTNLKGLEKYKFDSVDSTSWLYGNRGGYIYMFNGRTIVQINCPEGMRLKDKEVALHNFQEWVKFQRYAESNL